MRLPNGMKRREGYFVNRGIFQRSWRGRASEVEKTVSSLRYKKSISLTVRGKEEVCSTWGRERQRPGRDKNNNCPEPKEGCPKGRNTTCFPAIQEKKEGKKVGWSYWSDGEKRRGQQPDGNTGEEGRQCIIGSDEGSRI